MGALAAKSAVSVLADPRHADAPWRDVLVSCCHLPVRMFRGSKPMPVCFRRVRCGRDTNEHTQT